MTAARPPAGLIITAGDWRRKNAATGREGDLSRRGGGREGGATTTMMMKSVQEEGVGGGARKRWFAAPGISCHARTGRDGNRLTRCCCCCCWPPVQLSAISPEQPGIHLFPSSSSSHSPSPSSKAARSISSIARSQSDAQHRPVEGTIFHHRVFLEQIWKYGLQDGRYNLGRIFGP